MASGTPFEVVGSVVILVTILMVHFLHVVRVQQEVLSYQPMHSPVAWLTITQLYHGIAIAAFLLGQRQKSRTFAVGAHMSEVAHLILAVCSLNRFPLFHFLLVYSSGRSVP